MATGASLAASDSLRKLWTVSYATAKRALAYWSYTLSDKVWRQDVLEAAWQAVRRNGGACGVDGETVADVEELGVEGRLGELPQELREGSYRPRTVRQVLIPKKQPGNSPLRYTVPVESGSAVSGDAGAIADIRNGPATGAVCLPSRTQCAGGTLTPELVHREIVDGALSNFCGNPARGTAAIDRAAREPRTPAGVGQAMAGNGRGG